MKISECIFSPELMQRHCAIITDSDMHVVGTEKSSEQGAKIGESRKEKLEPYLQRIHGCVHIMLPTR